MVNTNDTKDAAIERLEKAVRERRSTALKLGPHTIKIYAAKDRPRYTICWYDGLKRERRESADPESVIATVQDLIKAYKLGKAAEDKITHDRVQEYIEADTALSGVNLSELVKFYREHMALHNKSVSAVVKEFLAAGSSNSQRHKDTVRLHLAKFCRTFQGQISHIRAAAIDKYLQKTFPNQKTRLNHRITVCSLFRFAQRKGYLPSGFTEAEKSERPRVPVSEPETISSSDLKKMLGLCQDKKLTAFLVVGAFAGCRASETQRLKWSDVKDDSIILGPTITKTRRRRIAEMPENLQSWVKKLRGKDSDFVTYSEDEFYTLYAKLGSLCDTAGVPWKKNCLRHSFVSCHLELHRDPPRTSKTAGHSLNMLETSYLKLVDQSEAASYFNIFSPENPLEKDPEMTPGQTQNEKETHHA
jgi:integrase